MHDHVTLVAIWTSLIKRVALMPTAWLRYRVTTCAKISVAADTYADRPKDEGSSAIRIAVCGCPDGLFNGECAVVHQ
jgi:hypothetical protein